MNLKVSGIAYDGSLFDLLGDKTMQRRKSLMFNTLNNIKTANIRLEVIQKRKTYEAMTWELNMEDHSVSGYRSVL